MKYLLFLAFAFPSIALAQQQQSVAPLSNSVATPKTADVQQALQGSLNPHGFTLAKAGVLYKHLADTVKNKSALRLRPGDNVVVERRLGRWIKVVRGNSNATGFSRDTTSYYMPASVAEGARIFILI